MAQSIPFVISTCTLNSSITLNSRHPAYTSINFSKRRIGSLRAGISASRKRISLTNGLRGRRVNILLPFS
jgi:hypothetical protein